MVDKSTHHHKTDPSLSSKLPTYMLASTFLWHPSSYFVSHLFDAPDNVWQLSHLFTGIAYDLVGLGDIVVHRVHVALHLR